MSTQRYISTSFWTDKWIRTLDPSERYLYMYLLTNPQTNISGIYQITLDRIAFDTGYDERTLRPMLDRFKKAGKAAFVHDEWLILPSWPKHQKWDIKETIRKGIESALKSIPQNVLHEAKELNYQYPIDTLLIGYMYSPSYSDSDSDSDLDIDASTDKPSAAPKTKTGNVFTPIFDTYISMYESIYGIKPVIVYSRITEQLKKITKDITVEQIVSAIGYSRDDDFAKKAKHELGVILSAGVIGRLVNASSQNSSPIPRKDSATVAKKCPTCGSILDQFNTCPKCHVEYDVTGRAI